MYVPLRSPARHTIALKLAQKCNRFELLIFSSITARCSASCRTCISVRFYLTLHAQKLIPYHQTTSLSVLDSAHVAPCYSLLLLYLEACPCRPRILFARHALPSSSRVYSRSVVCYFPPRPYGIGRCRRGHWPWAVVGGEHVDPSWGCCVWRLLYRNSLGRRVAGRRGQRIPYCM